MIPQTTRAHPKRIQRKRTKGWRMPANAVYVGRPSRYGNPYTLDQYRFFDAEDREYVDLVTAREMSIRDFEAWLDVRAAGITVANAARKYLRGKDLVCWCPLDQPCHADVLLELANL